MRGHLNSFPPCVLVVRLCTERTRCLLKTSFIQLEGGVIEIHRINQLGVDLMHGLLKEHGQVLEDDVLDSRDVLILHPILGR